MYKFIKYAVCFLITLFLLSCNNDELVKNQENASNVKKNLELNKFSNPNIVANVEVDFENVTEFEKDNFKISEIAAKEKVVNYFKSDLLQSQLKYQVITIEYENKSYSYFLEIYAHKKSSVYPMTITKLKDFSGTLNVYSFEGKNLGSIGLAKGMAKNISEKEDLNILTKAINLFSTNSNLTNRIPPCNTQYILPMQFTVSWYTETIVDGKPISYALTDVTTETIFVEMSNSCDAEAAVVARGYRDEIINAHSSAGSSMDFSDNPTPPSCRSFNFINTTGLWQTALVKNVAFKIVLLDDTGAHIIHSISYPQAILFGMPTNQSVGGYNISAGLAATLSAKALQVTMKEVVSRYGNQDVSEMVVDQYFKERLLHNYPMITSGGRVNFNSTENIPATDYQTTLLLLDDCE